MSHFTADQTRDRLEALCHSLTQVFIDDAKKTCLEVLGETEMSEKTEPLMAEHVMITLAALSVVVASKPVTPPDQLGLAFISEMHSQGLNLFSLIATGQE